MYSIDLKRSTATRILPAEGRAKPLRASFQHKASHRCVVRQARASGQQPETDAQQQQQQQRFDAALQPVTQPPQHQQLHTKLSRLSSSLLLLLAAALASAGKQQSAFAASLPPPLPPSQHQAIESDASSSTSSRSRNRGSQHSGNSSSRLDTSSSRWGQLDSSPTANSRRSLQPLLSTAAAPAAATASSAASSSSSSSSSPGSISGQQQQPSVSLDGLLPQEQAAVALFQRGKPTVVNITHMRAMPHFYTLDIHRMAVGQGSGFLWDKSGHCVTNYHVIKGAAEVKVTLHDHSTCTARVVGYDAAKDIAVLKLALPRGRLESLQPVSLGSSSSLRVGQACYAIGNPFGLDHTLTQGIVSGLGRELSTGLSSIKGVIQTDCAINAGNSGGVLLDSRGNVIGINIGILDPAGKGSFSGVGFAIPIDTVKGIVEQIITHGRVRRPSLGITIAPTQVLEQLGVEGVLILEVPAGTAAAGAGLRPTYRDVFGDVVLGDTIVGIDTRPVRSIADLIAALDERRPGDKVRCDVLREGKRLSVTVTLGERGAYCE